MHATARIRTQVLFFTIGPEEVAHSQAADPCTTYLAN